VGTLGPVNGHASYVDAGAAIELRELANISRLLKMTRDDKGDGEEV
jgi:hypothetical protein